MKKDNPPMAGYDVGQFGTESMLRLSRNEGPLSLPGAAEWNLSQDALNRYPDYRQLQQAYADWLGIDPAGVVVTAGGDEGIDRMIRTSVTSERPQVVTHAPSFEMVDIYTQQAGGQITSVDWLQGEFPESQYLQQLSPQTAMAVVVSPNNPTGQSIGQETLQRLAEQTHAMKIPLLVDLAYIEFAEHDPTPALLAWPHVVMVRTLSKAWGLAGLRVGFLVTADSKRAERLRRFGGPFTISHVSMVLAQRALGSRADTVKQNVEQIRQGRKELVTSLQQWGGEVLPSEGNFVLVRFQNAAEWVEELARQGIAVRSFGSRPELQNWIRITCPTTSSDLQRLSTAIRLLGSVSSNASSRLPAAEPIPSPPIIPSSPDPSSPQETESMTTNSSPRVATLSRKTNETDIQCRVNLDGSGQAEVRTGLGFLDHMLIALAKHSRVDISLNCDGDLHIDDHHSSEDCAIVLGEAIQLALGDRRGIRRFGSAYCPLDEALARVVIDLSGRPWPEVHLGLVRERIGEWATENVTHFFQTLAMHLKASLHVDVLRGSNDHHRAEAAFKALAVALRQAISPDGDSIPSTKGTLS